MLAKNLIVHGASRFLNTLYANDLTVGGTTTFSTLDVTGAANIAGTLTLSKTQDASGTADNKPALIVGSPTGVHLEFDPDEIMAKKTGTTVGNLYLNFDGGNVYIARKGTTYMGNGDKIHAADGTFTAVNYNGTNYTGTNATFDSGKMTNLMVTDTLRSFKWDIQTIADLGGTFVVAPTLYCTESVATFNVTAISGNTITAAIYDTAISGATLGGATWSANSKIKLSGKIGEIVLGTCDGTLTSQMNTTSHTMNIKFTYPNQTDAPLSVKNYSASEVSGLTVMLTTVGATNPVGIYMTSYDENGYSHISLYGGTAVNPTVRIGNLQGLPKINNVTPSGWGLYTDHGYFNGLIVSNQGKIGNFTISNALYSSTHSAYNTNVDGVYLGSDYISVGKQGAAYLKADGTGKIGRYTFASNGEFTTTVSNNTAGMGNATYAFWAGATSANAANAPFSVTYAGAIKSTSGTIGGFQIDSSSIRTANVAVTSNAKNSVSLSSADFKRTIEGVERSGLRFAIGSKFGVDNNGTLYANGVNITNINASNIKTGKLSADVIDAGSIDVSKLSVGAQTTLSNAAKTATSFITYVSASDGIKVHNADDLTDYVQVNSNAISFFRNNSERTKIEDAAVRVGGIGSNIRNVYITNSAVQIRNNTSVLAEYGSTISLYQPGTTTKAVEITGTGLNVANGTLTGSALTTTAGDQNNYEFFNGTVTSSTTSNAVLTRISSRGVQSWSTDGSTVYAQMLPAYLTITASGTTTNRYGWYITPATYARYLYTSGDSTDSIPGLVESGATIASRLDTQITDLLYLTEYPASGTAISGINGYVMRVGGMAVLNFASFSFAANTGTSATTYRLPSEFYPKVELDLVSTHNRVRFRITTQGFIRPYTATTDATAIRGTFTYMTDPYWHKGV